MFYTDAFEDVGEEVQLGSPLETNSGVSRIGLPMR